MRLFVALAFFSPILASLLPIPGRALCSKGRTSQHASCCVWLNVLDDIQENLFDGGSCNSAAHASLRLTFHDAIGYSPQLFREGKFGGFGADGSIMQHSDVETTYIANKGLVNIINSQRPFALAHKVSFGDFIQFAGAVGVGNCPGAPRLQFLAGRPNISYAAPEGLVPGPADSVDKMIARFADAGFGASEIVDLLASHSVATQHGIDPAIPGAPLDSTPGLFDSQFFVETLLNGTAFPGSGNHSGEALSPLPGEFRFQSDWALARDPRTACEWQSFVNNDARMSSKFQTVMAKMATLGQNRLLLTDCSDVIPVPPALHETPHLPAGKHRSDIQASCKATPFPALSTAPGAATSIPPVSA